MKKLFVVLIMWAAAFISSANAVDLKVHSNFFTLVGDASYSTQTVNGQTEYVMLFTYETEDDFYYYFPSVNVVTELQGSHISVSEYTDWSAGIKGQCVGIIKVSTNNASGASSTWGKGSSFNSSSPPVAGTVLAYFNGQSTYPSTGDGHALIYFGKDGSGNHIVIDQNFWGDKKNRTRRMALSGSSSAINYLNNYHIVTK